MAGSTNCFDPILRDDSDIDKFYITKNNCSAFSKGIHSFGSIQFLLLWPWYKTFVFTVLEMLDTVIAKQQL